MHNSSNLASWSIQFPSQTNYHPYGYLICTPVSMLAATTFIKLPSQGVDDSIQIIMDQLKATFTAQYVEKIMFASHKLYSEVFSKEGHQLMIQELYPWIPPNAYDKLEAGGLILTEHENETIEQKSSSTEAEDILLMSLNTLLQQNSLISQKNHCKNSVVVTAKGHTICFMCCESGGLFMFDSLPAVLCYIPKYLLKEQLTSIFNLRNNDVEYSALVLRLKKEG